MNTPSNKFGSSCTVTDGFVEKVAKMGVMETACELTQAKEKNTAAKKTDGSKTKTVRGIENFMDANLSGTAQSGNCILILCEGLSAMSGIVSGLSSEDRNIIGIYPLRGKLLNVRGESIKKITDNKEITDLKKILGLENGREYKSIEEVQQYLRYGKIIIMTDADDDGAHIAALLMTFFYRFMKPLILSGNLYLAKPPLYRVKVKNETNYIHTNEELDGYRKKYGDKIEVTRFKGLGEMDADELGRTTMEIGNRYIIRVNVENVEESSHLVSVLMGSEVAPRKEHIIMKSELRTAENL
jgi:DNA gyrase/topoisomerase IV subunit B